MKIGRKAKVYHFTKGEGKSIISRNEEGKVVILDFNSKNKNKVRPGEDWLCQTVISDDRKIVVEPIECSKSKAANKFEMNRALLKLADTGKFIVYGQRASV